MRILLIICAISYSCVCLCQKDRVYHKQFTKEDGLKIETINTIAYDNNGFVWLGGGIAQVRLDLLGEAQPTTLQRFNGYSFHSIALPDNDFSSVEHIYKRKDGGFYILTEQSLYLFNPITTSFKKIVSSQQQGVSKIFEYNNKEYILTQNELEVIINYIDQNDTLQEVFRFSTQVNKILITTKTKFIPLKEYCILSDDNFPITYVDWSGKVLKTIAPEGFDNERDSRIEKKWIDGYWQSNNEHYFLLYDDPTIYQLDQEKKEILPLNELETIPSTNLKTYNDTFGNTAILSYYNNRLDIRKFKDQKEIQTQFTSTDFNTISSINIVSNDLSQDLWFTTAQSLNYIKFPSEAVSTYLAGIEFRAMASLNDNNHIIASEKDGYYRFDSNKNKVSTYPVYFNGKPYKPSSSRNFVKDGPVLWSTDYKGGIIEIDTLTHAVTLYKHYPPTSLVKTTDTTLVYGTNGYALMEFNTQTKTHKPLLSTDSLFINGLEWVQKDNHIIAATNKGLLSYNLETNTHNFYKDKNTFNDPYLLLAKYHPDYGYLLGSRSGTLYSFDLATQKVKTIYQDELKAAIATVLFDNQKNIWINTFNGYVSFNPETQETHRFSVKDGFSNNEANRFSALQTKQGFLIGSIDGLNFFQPEALQPESNKEEIIPLRLRTYNTDKKDFETTYSQASLKKLKSIKLPPENRTLEIDFGLSQVNVTRNERYQYRLNKENWTALGDAQSIRFANLAPGYYTLEIEALNFSGKKIGESLILNINSKNFFYKTGWFFVAITLLIAGILIWMLRQLQLRQELQESFSQNLMQSQEEERARIAKDLHDSVGQQLTLIKRRLQEKGDTTISQLTHKTLEEVRHISRGLYPAILTQLGLSGSIEQLLYDIDEQTELFVSTDIADIDHLFDEKAALHIYRFIQENVSNVMKHAFAKAISVTIKVEHKNILIRIKDNGKGFNVPEAQKNNSLGLKTIEERIRILEGTLTLESNPEKGTLTTALIPYTHAKS